MMLQWLFSALGICLLLHGSHAQRAQATLRLAFKDVPLQQWLTPYGSNCVKLNCEVVGERPWVITYEVNGVPLDPQTRSDATALSDGSLVLCNVDPQRHSGSYRCTVTKPDRSSNAYKTLTLTESALRRYASTDTNLSPTISYIEITALSMGVQRVGGRSCIKVTCVARGSPPTITTRFSYNRVPVPSPFLYRDITVNGNMLTNCASDPSGIYNCTAVNGLGKASWRTTSVSNPTPPRPPIVTPFTGRPSISSFSAARVQNSNCIRLACVASPSNANVRVDFNGRVAGSSPRYTSLGRGILQVCYGGPSDVGTATCRATYLGRSATRTTSVRRSDYGTLPEPTQSPTENIVLSADAETCIVVSCRPDVSANQRPYIYVSVNGRYGSTYNRYKVLSDKSLQICDVDYTADAGDYRCETYSPRFSFRRSVSARELRDIRLPEAPEPATAPDFGSLCLTERTQIDQLNRRVAQLQQDLSRCNAGARQCEGLVKGVQDLVGPCQPYSVPRG